MTSFASPLPRPASRPRGLSRLVPLLPLPIVGAAIWYILAFNPTDRIADPSGPCAWHLLFGIDGPGCGGTRMAWYLLHGDLIEAARHHLLALIGLPLVGYAWLWWAALWIAGKRLPTVRVRPWHIVAYVIAFVLYSTVLRNLPWPPFTWFYVPDLTS